MLENLNNYKQKNHFLLNQQGSLNHVCNAPNDKSGIYIVYALQNGKKELIYIGCSGKIEKDGKMFIRKAGLGGIKDRLVNGHQFGKIARKRSWPIQMIKENIETLDIHWFVTHNEEYMDCPKTLEKKLLQTHLETYGRLPKWNNII